MSAPVFHGGGVTAAARHYGGRPEDWLDLSTGINPCPVAIPPIAMSAWHRLPDAWLLEQAQLAAATHYRSGEALPLPVPGTQSVIQLLPRLVSPGSIAILSPTYGEYEKAFASAGFKVDLIDRLEAIRPDHRAVVIVNPNNPTGQLFDRDVLLQLHEELQANGTMLVVDEAFGDMVPLSSIAKEAGARDGLIVFRSFGKFFGLAGLRLGFAIARKPVLEKLQDWLGPWAVSGPALVIATQLMAGDQADIRQQILSRSKGLQVVLSRAGLTIRGKTDLFLLVEHPDAAALYEHLAKAHILTRKFTYAVNWLRIGLAPDATGDQRLADALADFSAKVTS